MLKNSIKRLGIFFFYDKMGIVDKYVEYLLGGFLPYFSKIIVVVNGELAAFEREKLEKFGAVFERENRGFDVWAYKFGLELIGWEGLNHYDELILFNNTIMGPVGSFFETFEKMERKKVDFWGLTKFFEYRAGDPFGTIKYGYIPDHIQSHFIAVRNSLFSKKEFHQYWDNMPMIHSYEEAIGFHEAIFTKYFSDLGYQWEISVEMDELRGYSGYPLLMCPIKLLKDYGCPIFKKRSFFHDIDDTLRNTTGEQTSLLYNYLNDRTDYDVDMIWDPILRMADQYTLAKNLNLEYTLSTKHANIPDIDYKMQNKKVALIMHLHFEDLIYESFEWASSMPAFSHVYITTNSVEKKERIEEIFRNLNVTKLEIRLIENRGRDVSSLLIGVKDIVMDYDYVCFVHDKKTAQLKPESVGASFAYKCFENVLANKEFIYNVIETFIENPRLGILSPPPPNHAEFFPTLGLEWASNFKVCLELKKRLNLNVPMTDKEPPMAPLGTMFWFRPTSLKKLFEQEWEYEDFPLEPNHLDGTLLHGIERIYPYVSQDAGYYSAFVMSDRFSAIEFMNLYYYVRGFNKNTYSNSSYFNERMMELEGTFYKNSGIKKQLGYLLKSLMKKMLSASAYKKIRNFKNFCLKCR